MRKIDTRKSEIAIEETDEFTARRLSRRSYLTALLGLGAGFAGWRWLESTGEEGNAHWPLRRGFELNETISKAFRSPSRPSATFPASAIDPPRQNGIIGMETAIDTDAWRLRVGGLRSGKTVELPLDEIKELPRKEVITELRCIEGWSLVVQWVGASLKDFSERFRPAGGASHMGAATPDGEYYVGLDLATALHPQTLLCYEMNGEPLSFPHGAPLRLAVPAAYGIKHLKRLGSLEFTSARPPDYWAERGYDYYSAH